MLLWESGGAVKAWWLPALWKCPPGTAATLLQTLVWPIPGSVGCTSINSNASPAVQVLLWPGVSQSQAGEMWGHLHTQESPSSVQGLNAGPGREQPMGLGAGQHQV